MNQQTEVILENCPGCGAALPPVQGYIHRYVGASAACWAIYSALNNAGEPPLAPDPTVTFLTDAYMVQHPGTPSPQSIQSVAVHLLALYGYLERGQPADSAVRLRLQAVGQAQDRHGNDDPQPRTAHGAGSTLPQ